MSFLDKAEMRNVVALTMIFLMIGSWAYFLSQVEFDETKKLDGNMLVMIFANLIIGTIVGVFAWLGFKQGKIEPIIPTTPPLPELQSGWKATLVDGQWVVTEE